MLTVTRHTGRGGSRYYMIDHPDYENVRFPNVTSITGVLDKPALVGWAERMGIEACQEYLRNTAPDFIDIEEMATQAKGASRRKKEDAAEIGTKTHEIIESVLNGDLGVEIPPELSSTIQSFSNWYNQAGIVNIISTELPVVSVKYGYGGTIDVVARMRDGSITVFDWKTSNGLYKETTLQLSAYRQAYMEMIDINPEWLIHSSTTIHAAAVRLGKDYPAFEYRSVTNPEDCLTGFLACMRIREWHSDMKETVWDK